MIDQITAQQGDTIDLICYRHYGRTAGITEAVIEANPGVENFTGVIPQGTVINLPIDTAAETTTTSQLWD
ncbi:phage Tail Protein X [gamma proteobacterium HTCC5015]|nr:phage Tail Protein X [gamma proteobacterium HTCC5015]